MIDIKKVDVKTVVEDPNFPALIEEYAAECAILGMPHPATRIDMYYAMEKAGVLQVWASYDHDGTLIGFLAALDYMSPHYGARVAMAEAFFVAKAKRMTGAGIYLRWAFEKFAADNGMAGTVITAPTGGPLQDSMEASNEYKETHRSYFRPVRK